MHLHKSRASRFIGDDRYLTTRGPIWLLDLEAWLVEIRTVGRFPKIGGSGADCTSMSLLQASEVSHLKLHVRKREHVVRTQTPVVGYTISQVIMFVST